MIFSKRMKTGKNIYSMVSCIYKNIKTVLYYQQPKTENHSYGAQSLLPTAIPRKRKSRLHQKLKTGFV
jgi:hypothetical protein